MSVFLTLVVIGLPILAFGAYVAALVLPPVVDVVVPAVVDAVLQTLER